MTKQIFLLFGICLAGVVLSGLLPIPVPASVLAMLGVLLLLTLGAIKEHSVSGICSVFQDNMAFFFIPAGISMIEKLELLRANALALLAICLVGTLVTFVAAAFTTKAVMALQKKRRTNR